MTTRYTPGGWYRNIPPASKYPVIFAGRNTHVAQVKTQGLSADEIEGNADLIAAAPDLLAALERIAARRSQILAKFELHGPADTAAALRIEFESARAAIAKAKGETK